MKPLILASASPRRKTLLKQAGLRFKIIPSHVSEESTVRNPAKRVQELALRKARSVASKSKRGTILGADTLVVLGRQILGKPADPEDAYRMLYRLSGSTHRVLTGVALVDAETRRSLVDYAESRVRMKKLTLECLLGLSRKHLDKAGAYAIQELNDPIAMVIQGSYDNVVGLPIQLVRRMLLEFERQL